MIAKGRTPIYAKLFHKTRKNNCPCFVVKCAGLKRNGVCYVTGNDNQIGLFFSYHGSNRIDCLIILFYAHKSGTDMHIAELHYPKIIVGHKGCVVVFFFGGEL